MAANPETESPSACDRLMEEICERENLKRALKRVKANKGAPGVDGMTVHALPGFLREHWLPIRATLLNGTYKPQPVRRVEIPKPDGGGVRKLGIPCALDRFIQQAVLPRFRAGDFNGGTEAGVAALIQQLSLDPSAAEQRAAAAEQQAQHGNGGGATPFSILIIIIFVAIAFGRIFGGFGFWPLLFLSGLGGGRGYGGGYDGGGGGGWSGGGGGSFGGGGASGSW